MVEIVQDNIIPIVSEPFRLIGWIRMLKTEVLAAGIRAHSKELDRLLCKEVQIPEILI